MSSNPLPPGALDVLLKEYDALKEEIRERLKTAFSHVAYGGAIGAFAIPASEKIREAVGTQTSSSWMFWVPVIAAVFASLLLLWVAWLNMRWVQHCGAYAKSIEARVNEHFGINVLGWEHYADSVQKRLFMLIPGKPGSATARVNAAQP